MPIVIKSYPSHNKIQVIKLIRDASGCGLADAKAHSESLPYIIQELKEYDKFDDRKSMNWPDVAARLDDLNADYVMNETIDAKDVTISHWRNRARAAEQAIIAFKSAMNTFNRFDF